MSDTTIKDVQNLRQLTEEEQNQEWQRRQMKIFERTAEMTEWAYEQWRACAEVRALEQAREYAKMFAQLRSLPMPYAWYRGRAI